MYFINNVCYEKLTILVQTFTWVLEVVHKKKLLKVYSFQSYCYNKVYIEISKEKKMFVRKYIGGQNISCSQVVYQGYNKWIPWWSTRAQDVRSSLYNLTGVFPPIYRKVRQHPRNLINLLLLLTYIVCLMWLPSKRLLVTSYSGILNCQRPHQRLALPNKLLELSVK
jgi:hypothetical protein